MVEKQKSHIKLPEWFATAICGNDILSSAFYVSGISILFAGIYAPIVLAIIVLVLFFYKGVYTEVVEALPINGGAYNCLLNATSKSYAAIAGTMTILSYIATAVLSGKTAIEYLHAAVSLPVIPVTIGLLLVFTLLVISGIKDSAKVAFTIFNIHMLVLTVFLILGGLYFFHGISYFFDNLRYTRQILVPKNGLTDALFFGFATSLLGVSGFESSANFVEEQAKGVFRKTLRNMVIGVAIFNPLIALIALNVLPYKHIIATEDFLLSDAARVVGGKFFEYIVIGDAFLVLAGAVLTAFVGVSGLMYRMTTDGCFPSILAKQNKKGSYPFIVSIFFLLCASILMLTQGKLLSLAGVYTIAFLSVMSLFALGNLTLRLTRSDLKRTYHANFFFVILAFVATAAGVVGNIMINPANFSYFSYYFIPAILVVFITLHLDLILQFFLKITKNIPPVHDFLYRSFQDLTNGKFIVFIHHINRLHEILRYIDHNEIGRSIYLVHCNNTGTNEYDKSFKELLDTIPCLEKAGVYPQLTLQVVYKNKPFGPAVISEVSRELRVRKNRILIGSIHKSHPFDYEDLGGVRIIF